MSEAVLEIRLEAETKVATPIEVARMKVGQAVRQGDVIVQMVNRAPLADGAIGPVRRDRRDLAVGVRHSHVAMSPAVTYDWPPTVAPTGGELIYISSPSRWELHHDEHACMILPPGLYRSWRQVEFPAMAPRPVTVRD